MLADKLYLDLFVMILGYLDEEDIDKYISFNNGKSSKILNRR